MLPSYYLQISESAWILADMTQAFVPGFIFSWYGYKNAISATVEDSKVSPLYTQIHMEVPQMTNKVRSTWYGCTTYPFV